jgi:Lar family restriction alleviation protein
MSDLKACPFCGGKDVYTQKTKYKLWQVECFSCCMKTQAVSTEDTAIKAWNTRHATDD